MKKLLFVLLTGFFCLMQIGFANASEWSFSHWTSVKKTTGNHHCKRRCKKNPTRTTYNIEFTANENERIGGNPQLKCIDGPCAYSETKDIVIKENVVTAYFDVWSKPTQWELLVPVFIDALGNPGAGKLRCRNQRCCMRVVANRGWQPFTLPTAFRKIVRIKGNWSLDHNQPQPFANRLGYVSTIGQDFGTGQEKYYNSQTFPRRSLIMRARLGTSAYTDSPVLAPKILHGLVDNGFFRINEKDEFLTDNTGLLKVCFGD